MEIRQLTFTRFAAAFTILLFHYGQTAFPFHSGLLHHFAKEGAFAVSYFFCLSGYILAHVYYRDDDTRINKKAFYIKRFARIYPLYFLGFALALTLGIVLLHAIPKGNSILLQAFGLHAWVPSLCLEINYPAWSLSVELFFYLCFPFLINWFRRSSTSRILVFTTIVWIISAVLHIFMKIADEDSGSNLGNLILYNPLLHINTFIVGITARILAGRGKWQWSVVFSSFIFLACCIVLFLIAATDNPVLPWVHNGLLAPLFALIIISLHLNKKGISTLFSIKPLVFLGNCSYAMYILQHPVREAYEAVLQPAAGASATRVFYFYIIALILISAFAFLYIEKPLRQIIINRYYKKS